MKFIIVVDYNVDVHDTATVIWRWANNIDARRDSFVINAKSENEISNIVMDGTRKTKKLDGFDRPWPNILVMDSTTIQSINERWEKLNLGKLISSPSLRFSNEQNVRSAVFNEE